jgi:hypothetical protein
VDPGAPRTGERLGRRVDVRFTCPRERGNDRGIHGSRDGTDTFEISGRCRREAGLDHVDAQEHELLGDLHLLVRLQDDARRLLAVSQCRIEDLDPAVGHEYFPLSWIRAKTHLSWERSASASAKDAYSCISPRRGESR